MPQSLLQKRSRQKRRFFLVVCVSGQDGRRVPITTTTLRFYSFLKNIKDQRSSFILSRSFEINTNGCKHGHRNRNADPGAVEYRRKVLFIGNYDLKRNRYFCLQAMSQNSTRFHHWVFSPLNKKYTFVNKCRFYQFSKYVLHRDIQMYSMKLAIFDQTRSHFHIKCISPTDTWHIFFIF